MHRRRGNPSRHHTIGEARNEVRLEGQRRNPFENRGQHGRAGGVSTDADHHIGMKLGKHSARGTSRLRGNSSKVFSRVARLTRLSAPTWINRRENPAAGTRRFSIPRAVPMNSISAPYCLLEFLGDGEGRNHMSAGSASRQNGPHAVTINRNQFRLPASPDRRSGGPSLGVPSTYSACLLTFSNTPTHANVINKDDPP